MDNFDADLKLLEYRSKLDLPSDKDQALQALAAEVRRLNDTLAQNQQSFCKLYQSLIDKKRQLASLEKQNTSVVAQSAARVAAVEDKCGKVLAEAESLRNENGKLKETLENMKQERVRLREAGIQAEAEVKRKAKDVELVEARYEMLQRENNQLLKTREDVQSNLARKDKAVSDTQATMNETRELADNKVMELRETLLETQKDLSGQRQLVDMLRGQIRHLEDEKGLLTTTIANKDASVDRFREEILILNRAVVKQGATGGGEGGRNNDARSDEEFKRLKGIAEQLKDAQVDAERARMEGLYKDREYSQLKDQLAEAFDSKNQALRQADMVKYENQKLKEEQSKFLEDLHDLRDVYETQVADLGGKLKLATDMSLTYKAKSNEAERLNAIQKAHVDDLRKRLSMKEVELERMTSEKLYDLAGMTAKTRGRTLEDWKEPPMGRVSKDFGQEMTSEATLQFTRTAPWAEEQKKLDWDSLMFRIGQVGLSTGNTPN